MKFGAALGQKITVLVYADFESIVEIDRDRPILYDFTNSDDIVDFMERNETCRSHF